MGLPGARLVHRPADLPREPLLPEVHGRAPFPRGGARRGNRGLPRPFGLAGAVDGRALHDLQRGDHARLLRDGRGGEGHGRAALHDGGRLPRHRGHLVPLLHLHRLHPRDQPQPGLPEAPHGTHHFRPRRALHRLRHRPRGRLRGRRAAQDAARLRGRGPRPRRPRGPRGAHRAPHPPAGRRARRRASPSRATTRRSSW